MKVIGVFIVALALTVAIVPRFTDCQSQGGAIALPNGATIPMKCHWTGQAELAIAGPVAAVGILLAGGRRKRTIRAVAVLGVVLGLAVILIPAVLIGVCASDQMLCNMVMRPALIFAGILVMAASAVALLAARGADGKALIVGEGAGKAL
jgi:hypothetical protein